MIEVVLIYPTPEGSRELKIEGERLTIGRGAVDLRFDDNSLSRHHATIYHENGRVWILDENSTNGTFVNGETVAAQGTPLKNNDEIRVGNETTFAVKIGEKQKAVAAANSAAPQLARAANAQSFGYLPFVVIGIAVLIIGTAAFVIAAQLLSSGGKTVAVVRENDSVDDDDEEISNSKSNDDEDNLNSNKSKPKSSPMPKTADENANAEPDSPNSNDERLPPQKTAPRKTYAEMSDEEKRKFIEHESVWVARMIGNRTGEAVTPEAVDRIKSFVDAYSKRLRVTRKDSCSASGWITSDLQTVLERASKNAPFIVPAFNSEGLAPQMGLYLAMIESEHCVCLQSPTGPLGMFQFTKATAIGFGLDARPGASPTNPDERCQPEPAAKAAAKYMKFLAGRYGTGPLSFPLAIASYNSGEGGLSRNLSTAMQTAIGQERSFWTLVANQGKLSEQFQKENVKYVPKFFAAAIIGENPTVFGVNLPPLSSNTN